MKKQSDLSKFKLETRLALAGRDPSRSEGAVNPPIHRASTLLLERTDQLYNAPNKTYALEGMAIQEALMEALVAVEGGAGCTLAPSGLAACTLAIFAVARKDSEILVTDNVYGPTRRFCDTMLKRLGVSVRYFPPRIGAGIAEMISNRTCAVFMEAPGSLTFEFHDVPAIVAAAKAKGVPTIIDNTWSAGVYFKPFDHGIDLSVQALTKYQAGHADLLLGAVLSATPDWAARIKKNFKELGLGASPDDSFLVLRGLRTMSVRLERQSASALRIAQWLESRSEVAQVLHPALPASPDHDIWKRDFHGASGLFGLVLKPTAGLKGMLESLSLFGMGFSWGGYESLIVPCDEGITRTAAAWTAAGPLLRISVGLEHPDDLIADLTDGFSRLKA